jgi:hypothetical protein
MSEKKIQKVKQRKVENGIIVSCGKKEVFCLDRVEGSRMARKLYMEHVAPELADKMIDELFPPLTGDEQPKQQA